MGFCPIKKYYMYLIIQPKCFPFTFMEFFFSFPVCSRQHFLSPGKMADNVQRSMIYEDLCSVVEHPFRKHNLVEYLFTSQHKLLYVSSTYFRPNISGLAYRYFGRLPFYVRIDCMFSLKMYFL